MKIAFLCNSIFDNGGVQRVITTLSNLLCEDYEIEVICTKVTISENYEKYNLNYNKVKVTYKELRRGNRIREIGFKGLRGINKFTGMFNNKYLIRILTDIYYPKYVREDIVKFLNLQDYDIVIGCEGNYSLLLSIVKQQLNSKIITWQHNSYDAYFNTKYKYYWNRDELFKKYLHLADLNIVLTDSDKEDYEKNLKVKSKVIYNPLSFCTEKKSNLTNKNIISIGRFTKQKGFDNLLKAFKIINNKCEEWSLHLVGEGEDEKNLRQMVKELKLDDNVIFHPFMNNIEDIMRNSSIYAMSSRWEGFGLVVTEALELGIPVVTFNTTGPMEIIGDSNCGIVVDQNNIEAFANAVVDLAKNDEKRYEFSRNALKRVSYFYGDNIINIWEQYFKEIT